MKAALFCFLSMFMIAPGLAEETILLADFSNKPLNQPIGTGGASAGEPHQVSAIIDAVVRAAPAGGRELELSKAPSGGTASVRFHFLDNEEVSSGQLRFDLAIRLGGADDFGVFSLLLREPFNAALTFLNMDVFNDGDVQIRRSGFPVVRFSEAASLSRINRFRLLYDLDEKTISLCLNGGLLVLDLDAGIDTERGVGSLLFTLPAAGETRLWIDAIKVEKGFFDGEEQDRLFADRFETSLPACPF